MNKKKAKDYISKYLAQRAVKAQNGLYYESVGRFRDSEAAMDTMKSAGLGYLGAYEMDYAFNSRTMTPEQARIKAKKSAMVSGMLNGATSALNYYGERRDYMREMQRLREREARNYTRAPRDNYAYSDFYDNQYNNSAYKMGGIVKGRKKC